VQATADVTGLKTLISRQWDIENTVSDLKARLIADARARRLRERGEREKREREEGGPRSRYRSPLLVPARNTTAAELDALIGRLQALRNDLESTEFDIVIGEG
jgi:hypothetical protein